jgi:hypothetical protein
MAKVAPDAIVCTACSPTDEVIEGPQSLVWQQAENACTRRRCCWRR